MHSVLSFLLTICVCMISTRYTSYIRTFLRYTDLISLSHRTVYNQRYFPYISLSYLQIVILTKSRQQSQANLFKNIQTDQTSLHTFSQSNQFRTSDLSSFIIRQRQPVFVSSSGLNK
ncbi:hypothetical protein EGW08_000433 [Elysia chlorotica]|uniref:Secreted protein n=1 Tax=Elysia chlorotica TaxID=188477 RepID=A0A433UDP0_ELYCH|nr:hypothetical protein EGW08_000433 [Elysia chlorotica]